MLCDVLLRTNSLPHLDYRSLQLPLDSLPSISLWTCGRALPQGLDLTCLKATGGNPVVSHDALVYHMCLGQTPHLAGGPEARSMPDDV